MTAAVASLRTDARVIGLVGTAHGLSHFFQLCIPPLFPLIREEFGTSYAALGAVLAVFYGVSGIMQTVAGFLVDRVGARTILLAGLALIAGGTLAAGLVPSFAWLFVTAAIAGLGNSVFHPADLALLNGKIETKRLGYAFSVHGIAGNLGWVLAPLFVVPIAHTHGWRGALVAAGAMGLVFCAALATQRVLGGELRQHPGATSRASAGIAPLLARPVLLTFLFFFLYAVALVAFQTFATASLTSLHHVTLVAASTALTAFLLGGAAGILAAGARGAHTPAQPRRGDRRERPGGALARDCHGGVRGPGARRDHGADRLRARLDRAVAGHHRPRHRAARGARQGVRVRLLRAGSRRVARTARFGWALDRGRPDLVFVGSAIFLVAAIPTVMQMRRRGIAAAPGPAPAPRGTQ